MKTSFRLATLALVASAALAIAGNAFATQTMTVAQTSSALTIKVAQPQTDPQPAQITIYLPSTNQLSATQPPPGSTIGTTTGHVFARDLGIPLPLTGQVITRDPTQYTDNPCSPGPQLAVWDLQLSVAGQTINILVYVSQTTGDETALGAAKLVVCLAPADVPAGTPGRSPMGAQLLDATFTVNNVVKPTTTSSTWSSKWIPYGVSSAQFNPAGTVQVLSVVAPGAATIKTQVLSKKLKKVRITGRVTQGGKPAAGATVNLLLNSRSRFKTKTNAAGAYTFVLRNTRTTVTVTFFQASAAAAARSVTSAYCPSAPIPNVPCASATASPFTALSKKVRLKL
ncbi:MAG TPA: hypothetical protein VEH52_06870 [Gaiellaceae bacterium]|nr:hypothetical protein [Gaiellaceae bacterium]